MTKIKDNVKKKPEIGEILIKQGDMYYNERTKCYYTVTCVGEKEGIILYNLYNVNKANLFYNKSMELHELADVVASIVFRYVKDSEIDISGTLY